MKQILDEFSAPSIARNDLSYLQQRVKRTAARLLEHRTALTGVMILGVFLAFMALVQFSSPNMPGNDGFYHIKIAYLMRTEGLKPNFPYLPLTILNAREFYDHHFLFHVALTPFTFGDLRMGAKLASVTFASLAFLSIWWLLRKQNVPFDWLWALGLLAISQAFIYRMSITRAQSLSLAVLAVALHWMFTKKYRWLLPLGFLYVWLYNAFPLLLVIAALHLIARWLIDRELDFRPLIYSTLGVALGILINPYFPHNIFFSLQHILPKLGEATSIPVGNEWYPYDTDQLLRNSPLALIASFSGMLALGLSNRRMSSPIATGLFATTFFGLMLFQARRFVEYFPAFALIFAALAWAAFYDETEEKHDQEIRSSRGVKLRLKTGEVQQVLRRHLPMLVLAIFILPGMRLSAQETRANIRGSKAHDVYAGASSWLETNTPEGSRVFQSDWDDFPRLFFHNSHNTYLIGLDPSFMQLYSSDLYDLWVEITRGRVAQPGGLIAERFGAQYVMLDL